MATVPDGPYLGPAEYLLYRVLVERREQDNIETGRTKFFKLACLANARLQDEYDLDVELPWHWYKYGGVVEAHSYDRSIVFAPSANHQDGQAYYPAKEVEESDFDISDQTAEVIGEAARRTVEEYGTWDRDELEQLHYEEFAPNEFIRLYSELRWGLVALILDDGNFRQRSISEFQIGDDHYLEQTLDEMLVAFPEVEYANIYEYYLAWDDTMRLLVEEDARPKVMHDFLEMFITRLSEITLRFVHRHNIPERRLEQWRGERPGKIEALDRSIQEVRTGLLEDRPSQHILQSVAEAYEATITEQLAEL